MLGMILQRFELIDHLDYQLKIKQTLTIKPDGLHDQGPAARRPHAATPLPRAVRTRPPAISAEPAARRRARRGRPRHAAAGAVRLEPRHRRGDRATRSPRTAPTAASPSTVGALDDHVGALPDEGAVVVVTASYNGTPPDNAAKFCGWLRDPALPADALRRRALHRLRLRHTRLGGDLPGRPDADRRRAGGARRDAHLPARRRRRPRRLRRPVPGLVRRALGGPRRGAGACRPAWPATRPHRAALRARLRQPAARPTRSSPPTAPCR